MRRIILTFLILSLLSPSVFSQTQPFPTLDALQSLILPANDPVDLARRLRGVSTPVMPSSTPPEWQLGDVKLFSVSGVNQSGDSQVQAELRGMSDNILVWIDSTSPISSAVAQEFAERVDTTIYQQVQALWGIREPGGIDQDPRLVILMVNGLEAGIAGYFAEIHTYPRSIVPNSNQHEMMIINLSAVDDDILSPTMLNTIAHEYQHVLRHFIDGNEGTWIDEGFSTYTEHHLGWNAGRSQIVSFLNNPDVQLNQWVDDTHKFARYGATFLFVNYFVERFGLDALRQWSNHPSDNWAGLDMILQERTAYSADLFFADWVLANYFRDPDTGYGYQTLSPDIPSARPVGDIVQYPYQTSGQLQQYSTDYYSAFNLGDATALTIQLSQPDAIGLIPAQVFDGDFMMLAVPADSTDSTMTQSLDLSHVETATLNFRTWYDTEEFWDYAYVMVSTDNGQTWDILSGTTTTDRNPNLRAYGEGYTGRSFGWVQETVSLDAYTGQTVLLRFEMITDAATIRHGIAIDDLRIDAIGYHDSFEMPSDEWDLQGWIRTDNRLPQRTWVQVAQQTGKQVTVSRWLTDTSDNTWIIELLDDVELVLIAISPIAPQTMLESSYQLIVDRSNG